MAVNLRRLALQAASKQQISFLRPAFHEHGQRTAAPSTAHVPQYPRARVLKGNVKILAHSGRFGHRRDERVTDLIGITVEEAEPNQAADLPQFSQEQG